jgi:hypothetical protein
MPVYMRVQAPYDDIKDELGPELCAKFDAISTWLAEEIIPALNKRGEALLEALRPRVEAMATAQGWSVAQKEEELSKLKAQLHVKKIHLLRNFMGRVDKGQKGELVATPMQPLHMDLAIGDVGYVVILSLSDDFTLVVCPGSHKVAREWYYDRGAGMSEEDFASKLAALPVLRIRFPMNYIVIMDANTVHAGDVGKGDKGTPRMHWYIAPKDMEIKDETHPACPVPGPAHIC